MKQAKIVGRGRMLLHCGLLVAGLTGCTTYVQQPPVTYLPPAPEPAPPPIVEPAPPPNVEVTVNIRREDDFYDPLSPYGRWVIVGSYGRCCVPSRVAVDWRPYCNGYWQRTDAGWYWASDEPWGWATYHYGRWDFDPAFGWFWVPQTQWAPAWVTFQEGAGYVGWAPLPPSARVGPGGYVDVSIVRPQPRAFVFVEQRRFCEPVRPTTVVVNNTTIINKTVNVTKIKVVNNTVINEGPNTTVIEKASGRKIASVPAREMRRKLEAPVVEHQKEKGHVVESKPAPPQEKAPEPRDVREGRPAREVPDRREPRTPVRETPPVVKDTPVPATPANPAVRTPAERQRNDNVTETRPAPPKPRELKKEPRPAPAPKSQATGTRQERTVKEQPAPPVQRPAQAEVRSDDKEKPIKGRGADKQMKAAQETRQNKSPAKGQEKGQEKGKKKKEKESEKPETQPGATPP